MTTYSPAWPHGSIVEVLPDIFMVTGTNITEFNNVELQHSRNMVIIREGDQLSLINTVRLTDEGLLQLEMLGQIKNVIRIGAFHGRDDAFYVNKYHAKFWALADVSDNNIQTTFKLLNEDTILPFSDSMAITFETSNFPEALIYINKYEGVLISCDSIKNWLEPDEYFSPSTAELYQDQGFFGQASISSIWLQACETRQSDFDKLKSLSIQYLLSAHGKPLIGNADSYISTSIESAFSKS